MDIMREREIESKREMDRERGTSDRAKDLTMRAEVEKEKGVARQWNT